MAASQDGSSGVLDLTAAVLPMARLLTQTITSGVAVRSFKRQSTSEYSVLRFH